MKKFFKYLPYLHLIMWDAIKDIYKDLLYFALGITFFLLLKWIIPPINLGGEEKSTLVIQHPDSTYIFAQYHFHQKNRDEMGEFLLNYTKIEDTEYLAKVILTIQMAHQSMDSLEKKFKLIIVTDTSLTLDSTSISIDWKSRGK